jgi:gamma-polyglutamate synthase
LATLFIILVIFLLYLIIERIVLDHYNKSIPLIITVTGTRGKSSVVRMLASVLRENGKVVLAKTTGSAAKYIMPDASEVDVPRNRLISIIEQKNLIKKAAKIGAECVVAEIMSIHPENHFIESQQILKPNIVVITNTRKDHTETMGETTEKIASILSLDITNNSTCFIPQNENRSIFTAAVRNMKGSLVQVTNGISSAIQNKSQQMLNREFVENLDLVYAVAKHLKIENRVISDGILKTRHDIGKFKIWKYKLEKKNKIYYLVNAFSANDPESTFQVVAKLQELLPAASRKLIGLLTLRTDRGDRTLQWIEVLKNGKFDVFRKIFVTGTHSNIVKRKVNRVSSLKPTQPFKIMETILAESENQTMIFGFGNMAGIGRQLVDYWNEIGEEYGV